jgi:hypothetical protein
VSFTEDPVSSSIHCSEPSATSTLKHVKKGLLMTILSVELRFHHKTRAQGVDHSNGGCNNALYLMQGVQATNQHHRKKSTDIVEIRYHKAASDCDDGEPTTAFRFLVALPSYLYIFTDENNVEAR